MLKVLNLYAGLGGNRRLWEDVCVTAVEINPKLAKIYQDFFPNDTVIVGDAHQFLLNHFDGNWDFIWCSPPCESHSRMQRISVGSDSGCNKDRRPVYPDMRLYQEIVLLKCFCNCKWAVENVRSYYEPLVMPQILDRHFFWCNFLVSNLPNIDYKNNVIRFAHSKQLQVLKDVDVSMYKLSDDVKDKALRSYVNPVLGKHVFDCAFRLEQEKLF